MNKLFKRNLKKIRNNIRFYPHRKKKVCLIATMPKSGTWFCQYFFWALNKSIRFKDFDFGHCDFNKIKIKNFLPFYNSSIFIGHASCPGYELEINDKLMNEWKKLKFWNSGYNWVNHEINKAYYPLFNKEVIILYIYREPLSQIFSLFNYCKDHKDLSHRRFSSVPLIDFYTKVSAVDSYIKQYHTFKYMSNLYPNNVYMIKYENLISDPTRYFSEMCELFDIMSSSNLIKNNIKAAVDFVSIENLKSIEKKTSRSLANDGSRESHIQGEKYGKFSDFLNEDDYKLINKNLNILEYSLDNFKI
tara:strand:- start:1898 stop:2806 length:909 start_codon:yes stop_codon:yes gene_type:complete